MPTLNDLALEERRIAEAVGSVRGTLDQKAQELARGGRFDRYREIHREYAALARAGDVEALRRSAFLQWISVNDRVEPPHVHVEARSGVAKFWLNPVRLAGSRRMARHELSRLHQLGVDHQGTLVRAWHAHFNG